MALNAEIVITGVGVVSPIGIGKDAFWAALCEGRSGVRRLDLFDAPDLPVPFGAPVADFDAKLYIRPRKSLKVMGREIQLAFAAADLACAEARLGEKPVDPQRLGIVFGAELMPCDLGEMVNAYRGCTVDGTFDFQRWGETAMAELFPLWMLKYLPNMPACHIGIVQDARGPNNTLTLGEVSSLAAVEEAARVIERGQADVMIAGGCACRIHPALLLRGGVYQLSRRSENPAAASRPFDALRDGMVNGEGAGALVLERREHALARRAPVLARVLGFAGNFEPHRHHHAGIRGKAIRQAIAGALRSAGLAAADVGHVNANGLSTVADDRAEAHAIHAALGDVPVTAPKSFFGNLGAGTGAVEMAASVLALEKGLVPYTLNYEQPDPDCPVNVVRGQPLETNRATALVLNHTIFGQAVAVVLGGDGANR